MKMKTFFAVCGLLLFVGAGCVPSPSNVPSMDQSTVAPATVPAETTTPSPQPTPATTSTSTPAPTTEESISISGFSFQPSSLTIQAGTTVVWTNQDSAPHTITADNGSFDSGTISSNGTYSRTFTQTGSFVYHCDFHPSMQGTIIVQ